MQSSFIHSFSVSNGFILIRVLVVQSSSQEILGTEEECILVYILYCTNVSGKYEKGFRNVIIVSFHQLTKFSK